MMPFINVSVKETCSFIIVTLIRIHSMIIMTLEQLVILIFFIQLIWADHAIKRSTRATEANKQYKDDDYGDNDYYYQDDKVNPSIFLKMQNHLKLLEVFKK